MALSDTTKQQGQGHDLTSNPVRAKQNNTTWTNKSTIIVRKQVNAANKNLKGSDTFMSEQLSQETSAPFFTN